MKPVWDAMKLLNPPRQLVSPPPSSPPTPVSVEALAVGCPREADMAWGFSWSATPPGFNATMRCEENPVTVTGEKWAEPVLQHTVAQY